MVDWVWCGGPGIQTNSPVGFNLVGLVRGGLPVPTKFHVSARVGIRARLCAVRFWAAGFPPQPDFMIQLVAAIVLACVHDHNFFWT